MELGQVTVKISTEDRLNSQALEFLLTEEESKGIKTGIATTEDVRKMIILLRERYFSNYQSQLASVFSGGNLMSDMHRAKALVRTLEHFNGLGYGLKSELAKSERLYVEIV